MALSINAGADARRTDLFMVDPYQIIVKEDLRGRLKPPTQEQIIDMAESLAKHGQQQPVQVRKVHDKQVQLVLGFTRCAAARLIREGFDFVNPATGETERIHFPEFKLKVVVADVNEEQALLHNIIENAHRKDTSPIDDAYNHNKLRDKMGKTDAEITRIYRYKDSNRVGRCRKLLGLPNDVQEMVHDGRMAVSAALALLELPEEEMKTAIAAAVQDNGKVSGAAINDIVRDHHLRDADKLPETTIVVTETTVPVDGVEAPVAAPTKNRNKPNANAAPAPVRGTPHRTMKNLKAWLEQEREDEGQKAFLKVFSLWIAGKRADKTLNDALDTLTDYERTPS